MSIAIVANKAMREAQTSWEAALAKAQAAATAEERRGFLAEANGYRDTYETERALLESAAQAAAAGEGIQAGGKPTPESLFSTAARSGFRASMVEGTNANGGYTVPEDIQTRIRTLLEERASLLSLINVEAVSAPTGARTRRIRSNGSRPSLGTVSELAAYSVLATPTYGRKTYACTKKGGIFVVSDELLEDSDANITSELTRWIADVCEDSDNAAILAKLQANAATDLTDLDGMKKKLLKTLGAFPAAAITTNDDGVYYLATLKDGNGHELLQPNPAAPMTMTLAVGPRTYPIHQIPNAVIATNANNRRIPFFLGDLKEGITKYDRRQMTIIQSSSAIVNAGDTENEINAFEDGALMFRVTVRNDYVDWDASAWINGYIAVASL